MIGLYRGMSWVSRVIEWRTWSRYSHAAWIEPAGRTFEAWYEGIPLFGGKGSADWANRYDSRHTPGTVIDLFGVHLTPGEHDGLCEFFTHIQGQPYDLAALFRFLSRNDRGRAEGDKRWICSEVILAGFIQIRKPLLLRVPAYKSPPEYIRFSPLLREAGQLVCGAPAENGGA